MPVTMVDTLGDALPREMTRVRKLIPIYQKTFGPTAIFAINLMNHVLDEAQTALVTGDVVAMIRVYQDLQGFKE